MQKLVIHHLTIMKIQISFQTQTHRDMDSLWGEEVFIGRTVPY